MKRLLGFNAFVLAVTIVLAVAASALASPRNLPGIDARFGKDGMATSTKLSFSPYAMAVAAGPHGQIVTGDAYQRINAKRTRARSNLQIAKFSTRGIAAKRFGTRGIGSYRLRERVDNFYMAIDPQGRVVVLVEGIPDADGYDKDLLLLRLTKRGTRDMSFNHGKPIRIYEEVPDFFKDSMKVDKSGAIYVYGGYGNVEPEISKFDARGRSVRSYGQNGRAGIPHEQDDSAYGLQFSALGADGSVFISGSIANGLYVGEDGKQYGASRSVIHKLTPQGRPDVRFGEGGTLLPPPAGPTDTFTDLGVSANGDITAILLFQQSPATGADSWATKYVARRFTSTGAATTFGTNTLGAKEIPLPLPVVPANFFAWIEPRFGSDGSYERLTIDRQKDRYELTTMSADGSQVNPYPVLELPERLSSFGESTLDPRDGSLLIAGTQGHRLAVLRFTAPKF